MSGGQLEVRVFAAGELVPAFGSFDAVSSGNAEMCHSVSYYWQGKSPAFNFFTAVPFGLRATEHAAWITYGGGQELWDEVAAPFDIKRFLRASTGVQMGGWFNQEINSLDDYKGLKFRMPGLGGEVLRRLGAAVINLPVGEIFPALQAGTIDGTEWVGPWHDMAAGFYKVAKFYYWPGWHEPGTTGEVMVNLKAWERAERGAQGDHSRRGRGRGLAGVLGFQCPQRRCSDPVDRHARRAAAPVLRRPARPGGQGRRGRGRGDRQLGRADQASLRELPGLSSEGSRLGAAL
jgi:hypothetical protein